MARRRTFGYIRKLPSGRWQASYLDDRTAERVWAPSTFATRTDASLWLSSVETDMARARWPWPCWRRSSRMR